MTAAMSYTPPIGYTQPMKRALPAFLSPRTSSPILQGKRFRTGRSLYFLYFRGPSA